MAFQSLCQKLDVDNIRAKFPPLPAMPQLPQIKLPKSMPKIKSRKIFRSSRENVNRNDSQKHGKGMEQQQPMGSQSQLPYQPPIPHASFIKKTPTRISTITSLVHQDSADGSTYRSADSIDDDFNLSRRYSYDANMRPISPLRVTTLGYEPPGTSAKSSQTKLTLTERLHRSYKDLTEFRLKNLFVKKTVVRKDNIQVQHYVERYEEDLIRESREQEERDRSIADNYAFRFKLSRQNTDHSNSVTPDDSPRSEPIIPRSKVRTVGEHSGDESGMEATPPPRKPGIAATRFAKVRNPPLRQSSSEREMELGSEKYKRPEPIPSALWSTKIKRMQVSEEEETDKENEPEKKATTTTKSKFRYKESMRRLTSYMSSHEDGESSAPESANKGSTKMLNKLKNFGKRVETTECEVKAKRERQTPNSPRSTDEEPTSPKTQQAKGSPTARTFDTIKSNFKRLQQSLKVRQHSTANTESEDEGNTPKTEKTQSKTEKLTSRLRRFRSRDVSSIEQDDEEATKQTQSSPIRQAISNKFETWKKSFKKKNTSEKTDGHTSDGETSPEKEKPEKPKRSDTLMKKLRHIRSRKQTDSKDEVDNTNQTDTEVGEGEVQPKARKFTEARQRTLKKVNEKMQQMKFFHKSQEQTGGEKRKHKPRTTSSTSKANKYHSEEEDWDESPDEDDEDEECEERETAEANINLPPTITRRDFGVHNVVDTEQENNKPLPNVHRTISIPTAARTAWTSKPPILSESLESDIDPNEFPRVLIHQDNSDCFESTLIIAVTRSPSTERTKTMSPRITEIPNEAVTPKVAPPQKLEKSKETGWIPNKNIIAGFLETTPPGGRRKKSIELDAPPMKQTRRRSRDSNSNSNSDSDSWLSESKRKENTSRRSSKSSQAGLLSIDEQNEAWKIKNETGETCTTLYKAKSIDIFEKNTLKGGVLTAFEDFDDELKNEPVLKIAAPRNADSLERESSEDTADDDNSSRITKVSVGRFRENSVDSSTAIPATIKEATTKEIENEKKTLQQYANSRESLIANFDENEENDNDDDDDDDDDDRPPSAAPSPPPKMSPPPPPLPQRQPSMRLTKNNSTESTESTSMKLPPPLPKSKPPLPPPIVVKRTTMAPPPRIPERTASMPRAPKPLVKTSSLRLVFSEQVKPADVGKVNKLISRFEPTEVQHTIQQRPRIVSRRIQHDNDSDEYSDDEEDFATMADKLKERYANIKIERDTTTPTPTNTPKINTPEAIETPEKKPTTIESIDTTIRIKRDIIGPVIVTTTDEDNNTQVLTQHVVEARSTTTTETTAATTLDLAAIDTNSNLSRPNSEYGSPLEFPSSLTSSMETIPGVLAEKDNGAGVDGKQRLHGNGDRRFVRSRRSMPRDANDNFYSFDSDEENSYYSISSTGSNRYVVEL